MRFAFGEPFVAHGEKSIWSIPIDSWPHIKLPAATCLPNANPLAVGSASSPAVRSQPQLPSALGVGRSPCSRHRQRFALADDLCRGETSRLIVKSLRWLMNTQAARWRLGRHADSPSNIVATMLVRAAFHLTCVPGNDDDMLERADAYIRTAWRSRRRSAPLCWQQTAYGLGADQLCPGLLTPWSEVPQLPFELAGTQHRRLEPSAVAGRPWRPGAPRRGGRDCRRSGSLSPSQTAEPIAASGPLGRHRRQPGRARKNPARKRRLPRSHAADELRSDEPGEHGSLRAPGGPPRRGIFALQRPWRWQLGTRNRSGGAQHVAGHKCLGDWRRRAHRSEHPFDWL